jgi:hypothetical protein
MPKSVCDLVTSARHSICFCFKVESDNVRPALWGLYTAVSLFKQTQYVLSGNENKVPRLPVPRNIGLQRCARRVIVPTGDSYQIGDIRNMHSVNKKSLPNFGKKAFEEDIMKWGIRISVWTWNKVKRQWEWEQDSSSVQYYQVTMR